MFLPVESLILKYEWPVIEDSSRPHKAAIKPTSSINILNPFPEYAVNGMAGLVIR